MMDMNRRRLFDLAAVGAIAAAGCARSGDSGSGTADAVRAGTGEVADIVGPVPPISSFPTVAEMNAFIDRLAVEQCDRVTITEIGRSQAGQAIRNVRIGSGPHQILVLGSPHSNEPIGLATTQHLMGRLAADESLSASLGVTWNFVPLVDPDSTLLGQGWFGGPFTRTNVARNFYRPPSELQAEWTFPMTWRGNPIGKPLPETLALLELIDATEPALVTSLHNADYGGGFCYVTGGDADYWSALTGCMLDNDVPLHRGEPDAPGARLLTEGIFAMPTFEQLCDAVAAAGGDPTTMSGGSSGHYAARYGSAYLVSELPLWTDPRLTDDSPSNMSLAQVTQAGAAIMQEVADVATEVLTRTAGLLDPGNPLLALVQAFTPEVGAMAAAERATQVPDRMATQAEVATDLYGWPAMLRLRIGGPLDRLLREEAARTGSPVLQDESTWFGAMFDRWCVEIERDAPGQLVPLNRLVAIQAAAIVTSAARLRDGRPL